MKTSKLLFINAGLAGLLCGTLSGYLELGPIMSIIFWGFTGAFIGFFVDNKKEILYSGVSYGFLLTVAFLLSHFGGAVDKLSGYSLLILFFSIGGVLGGALSIFLGYLMWTYFLNPYPEKL